LETGFGAGLTAFLGTGLAAFFGAALGLGADFFTVFFAAGFPPAGRAGLAAGFFLGAGLAAFLGAGFFLVAIVLPFF
jgi:hypothetical protein